MLHSAFQTNKAARSPPKEGPVSHPHSGDKPPPPFRDINGHLSHAPETEEWPHVGLTAWTSAHVQRSKGGSLLRCSQSQGWSRVDATCQCARWQVAAHKEGNRVDLLANVLPSLAFSLGGGGFLLWAWAGGHHCCAMERQGQRPRNETFYQRFCLSETGLVLGRGAIWFSESSPENLTSIRTRASSQRAFCGQQGHTHTPAKHIKYPKISRKDPGLTTHAYRLGLHQIDCVPEMESWLIVSLKQLGN